MTPRHSAWQAWHLATSTLVSRGRRGTWRHRPWFCVAGVALGDIHYFLRRTPSFTYRFVTHNSSHTTCFTSRSSTTSCVFPSISVPATTFVAHFWKKLTCGVIRSFNSLPGWRKWGWTKAIKATNSKNICPELRRLHVDTDYCTWVHRFSNGTLILVLLMVLQLVCVILCMCAQCVLYLFI